MSDRMSKILEAGEENRQADIELGRRLERERIIGLVDHALVLVSREHISWLCDGCDFIARIKGENE